MDRTQSIASAVIAASDKKAQAAIQVVTRTLIKEVPTYVTQKSVDACVVPLGFIRLFNAGVSGVTLPDAPSGANDAPSGVGLDTVARVTVSNDAAALSNAKQLSDLQAWVLSMQAADK